MLVYASVCAVLLLAGLGEAKEKRPRAYSSVNDIVVTHAYSGWGNAPDACFQLNLVPLFLSKENRRPACKALRNAGKRHGWVHAVRYEGKWVSKRLKLQLPASARKLSNRELKEGEKGEVVEETNPDVVHVTLCEKPGSHKRNGHRRHSRNRRHRRHHRHHHHHARRHDRSRDRRSYSLDRNSEDHNRSRSTDNLRHSHDRSDDSHDRRDRRGHRGDRRGLRRTGGGWLDPQSTDTEAHNRRERRDRSQDRNDRRSYERDDRRSRRDRSVSSDRHRSRRSPSYSDDDSRDNGRKRSYSDDYSRSRQSRRSRRSRSHRSSRRDHDDRSRAEVKGVVVGATCLGGIGSDTSKCPMQHLLTLSHPGYLKE